MPPSELRRRMRPQDFLDVMAYIQLKDEFDGKPPPPPDDEDPFLLQVMANPERHGLHG